MMNISHISKNRSKYYLLHPGFYTTRKRVPRINPHGAIVCVEVLYTKRLFLFLVHHFSFIKMPGMVPYRRVGKRASYKTWHKRHYPTLRAIRGVTSGGNTAPGTRSMFTRLIADTNVFPPVLSKNLRYCDYLSLSSTAVLNTVGVRSAYRLNSLFDPDLDNVGTNHQPYFFDQVSGLYAYYRVYEVAWKITFTNPSSASCYGAVIITPSADTYTLTGKQQYAVNEKPGAWSNNITDSGSRVTTVAGQAKLWEIEGQSYQQWLGNSGYQSVVGSNPPAFPLLQIGVGDYAAPVTPSQVRVLVELTFKSKLFTQQTQTAS